MTDITVYDCSTHASDTRPMTAEEQSIYDARDVSIPSLDPALAVARKALADAGLSAVADVLFPSKE